MAGGTPASAYGVALDLNRQGQADVGLVSLRSFTTGPLPNDGVTDATALIQAAVDALGVLCALDGRPRQLLMPIGRYLITADIVWRPGVGIKGAGRGATVLLPTGPCCAIYGNQNGVLGFWFDRCYFADFDIDGAAQTTRSGTPSWVKGVFLQFLRRSAFKRVRVLNTLWTGFGVDYLDGVLFDTCQADGCGREQTAIVGAGAGFGIATGKYDQETCVIVNCDSTNNKTHGFFTENKYGVDSGAAKFSRGFALLNSRGSGNRSGFCDAGSDGALVDQCDLSDNLENGVYLGKTGANTSAGKNGRITRTAIRRNGSGTGVANPGGVQFREMLAGGYTISDGNAIEDNTGYGLRGGGATTIAGPLDVSRNTIARSTLSGFRIYQPDPSIVFKHLSVNDNRWIDNVQSTTATDTDAMTLACSLDAPSARRNAVINTDGGGGRQRYAVYLKAPSAIAYVTKVPLIDANDCVNLTSTSAVANAHTVADTSGITANVVRRTIPLAGSFSDNFNRADATLTGTATATGAQTWASNGTGTPQIVSNQLAVPDTGGAHRTYVNNGRTDGTFTATCSKVGSTRQAAVVARYAGGTNGIEIAARNDAATLKWTVKKRVSGTLTTLAVLDANSNDGDVVQVTCTGQTVTVAINGVVKYEDTIADYATATSWGVLTATSDVRWDDISFA